MQVIENKKLTLLSQTENEKLVKIFNSNTEILTKILVKIAMIRSDIFKFLLSAKAVSKKNSENRMQNTDEIWVSLQENVNQFEKELNSSIDLFSTNSDLKKIEAQLNALTQNIHTI